MKVSASAERRQPQRRVVLLLALSFHLASFHDAGGHAVERNQHPFRRLCYNPKIRRLGLPVFDTVPQLDPFLFPLHQRPRRPKSPGPQAAQCQCLFPYYRRRRSPPRRQLLPLLSRASRPRNVYSRNTSSEILPQEPCHPKQQQEKIEFVSHQHPCREEHLVSHCYLLPCVLRLSDGQDHKFAVDSAVPDHPVPLQCATFFVRRILGQIHIAWPHANQVALRGMGKGILYAARCIDCYLNIQEQRFHWHKGYEREPERGHLHHANRPNLQ